jgi:hypothetical protein
MILFSSLNGTMLVMYDLISVKAFISLLQACPRLQQQGCEQKQDLLLLQLLI